MQDKISRLLLNYSNARKSWESWCFMNEIWLTSDENFNYNNYESIRETVENNVLFSHFRYLALKDFYIEIYKIIKDSNSTKDNVFLILREAIIHKADFKDQIENSLHNLESLKPEIKKITDIRDKFYAHLDPGYDEYICNIKLESYNDIFIAIENSIITLTSKNEFQKILDSIPSRNEFYLYKRETNQ